MFSRRKFQKLVPKRDQHLTENVQNFIFNSVKLNIIGENDMLPDDIQQIINDARELLNEGEYTINLAFAYDFNKDLDNHGVNNNPNYNREQSNIDILFRSGMKNALRVSSLQKHFILKYSLIRRCGLK